MKAKLNLTIDEELIPVSKEYARSQGMSVSQLVEELLLDVTRKAKPSFSQRWQGKFRADEKPEPRYEKLKQRFLT